MARIKKIGKEITLTFKGKQITADKLRRGIGDFYSLLDEVGAEVTGQSKAYKWLVSVKKGSIVFASEPLYVGRRKLVDAPSKIIRAVKEGIEQLDTKKQRPEYFNDRALELIQDLASLPDAKGNGLKGIVINFGEEKDKKIGSKYISTIEDILGFESQAFGSIEGKLETLSGRGGLRFNVFDSIHDQSIRCNFYEDLLDLAKDAFEKRVYVYGLINYGPGGYPKSIKVEKMKIFPDQHELPSAYDVCGILGR